jgi:Domain of unknown function (DUF5680)
MDEAALLRFLMDASQRGYAAGHGAVKVKEADHSTTIVLEHGKWKFHDNYFGGEPYGGREVVFVEGRPVWMAVYYGWIEGATADPERVYAFLQRALREAPAEFPVRGPDEFSEGQFIYRNEHVGGVANFSGEETIHEGGRVVYTARYVGGLVDRRQGD